MPLKIALAGNPNSGKTTLFNQLTGSQQHVGNWPGVTVEKKEGSIKGNKELVLVDLPGIYSLSPYTLEEVVSRNYLLDEHPDAIINIVDATNLERNLYLTTQLLEIGIPVVIAMNMIDIIRKHGDIINIDALSEQLGCPIIEVSALRNIGASEVVAKAVALVKEENETVSIHKFKPEVEAALAAIEEEIKDYVPASSLRWYSIKFFERDEKVMANTVLPKKTTLAINTLVSGLEQTYDDDSASMIINERYDYISDALKENFAKKNPSALTSTQKIDRVVTHPVFALPIFVGVMFLVYYLSISTIGTGLTDTVNGFFEGPAYEFIESNLASLAVAPWLSSLILDGILAGVGAVIGFLPQMMILFFLLAILEDSGYMARIAFIMDKLFRRFGLSGKSFIPMLVTTGCGVPGIMATRTIESERDRKMTAITTTFVPCSAKLPVIALVAGALFNDSWLVAPSMYFLGIGAVIVSGIILKKTKLFAGDAAPFVMELPPYRLPSLKSLVLHMWEKGKSFVARAGSVIFVSACIIWFLSNFNWSLKMVDADLSILASLGGIIAPIFAPLGWGDWRATVATLTGLVAKENVVGTLAVLVGYGGEVSEAGNEIWSNMSQMMTPMAGFSFLAFNMLCAPCFAAIGALKKELGTKWMWIAVGYQTLLAYLVALVVFQLGTFFTQGVFSIGTVVAAIVVILTVYLLVRPAANKKKNQPALQM